MRVAAALLFLLWTGSPFLAADTRWSGDNYRSFTAENWTGFVAFQERLDFQALDYPLLNAAVFFATNEARLRQGMKALPWAPELERSAWNHAKRMCEKDFFEHEDPFDPRRKEPSDRGRLAGIANPSLAENIADTFGLDYDGTPVYTLDAEKAYYSKKPNGPVIPPHTYQSFARDVVDQWMHSPAHRDILLSPDAVALGCGVYYYLARDPHLMPSFKAVQNFQWYNPIQPGPVSLVDPDKGR